MIEIVFTTCILLVFVLLVYRLFLFFNFPIFGKGAHPLGLLFIIQFAVFSLPGVLFVSFLGFESFRYEGIKENQMVLIGLWYIYSLVIFVFLLPLFLTFFKVRNYHENFAVPKDDFNYDLICKIFVILSFVVIFFHIMYLPEVPLLQAIQGDAIQAYRTRVELQSNPDKYNIPYVSNLMFIFLYFQAIFVYYCWRIKGNISGIYVALSLLCAAYSVSYDIQKYKLVVLMVSLLFLDVSITGKIKDKIFKASIILVVLVQMYIVTMGVSENTLLAIIDRAFLAQNQGFYHMINSIEPSENYWWDGFYFIKRLGIHPSRPDVDVVHYIYGYYAPVVNVNSYYLGQAWAMYGYIGLALSPIIVSISVALFIKIIDIMIGFFPMFYIPYTFVFVPTIKVNQSFSYFLFGKEFLTDMILFSFLFLITYVISRVKV